MLLVSENISFIDTTSSQKASGSRSVVGNNKISERVEKGLNAAPSTSRRQNIVHYLSGHVGVNPWPAQHRPKQYEAHQPSEQPH